MCMRAYIWNILVISGAITMSKLSDAHRIRFLNHSCVCVCVFLYVKWDVLHANASVMAHLLRRMRVIHPNSQSPTHMRYTMILPFIHGIHSLVVIKYTHTHTNARKHSYHCKWLQQSRVHIILHTKSCSFIRIHVWWWSRYIIVVGALSIEVYKPKMLRISQAYKLHVGISSKFDGKKRNH